MPAPWVEGEEEERVYLHPLTGYPSTRDECWDYARAINYVDAGEAVEMVWNKEANEWEIK